jgi:hypothetical protein
LKLLEGESVDWDEFSCYINDQLPSFARPYFIRIRSEIDATNSFKQLKRGLQNDGFDPSIVTDPLYFLHPASSRYLPMSQQLYEDIVEKRLRF